MQTDSTSEAWNRFYRAFKGYTPAYDVNRFYFEHGYLSGQLSSERYWAGRKDGFDYGFVAGVTQASLTLNAGFYSAGYSDAEAEAMTAFDAVLELAAWAQEVAWDTGYDEGQKAGYDQASQEGEDRVKYTHRGLEAKHSAQIREQAEAHRAERNALKDEVLTLRTNNEELRRQVSNLRVELGTLRHQAAAERKKPVTRSQGTVECTVEVSWCPGTFQVENGSLCVDTEGKVSFNPLPLLGGNTNDSLYPALGPSPSSASSRS